MSEWIHAHPYLTGGIALGGFLALAAFCACILSSRISRELERRDEEHWPVTDEPKIWGGGGMDQVMLPDDRQPTADEAEDVAALGVLPEALVKALKDATAEQLAEIADAAVCLRAFPDFDLCMIDVSEGAPYWIAEVDEDRQGTGSTRAEALHALAESVKPEVNPWMIQSA